MTESSADELIDKVLNDYFQMAEAKPNWTTLCSYRCLTDQHRWKRDAVIWVKKWPNHCQHCNGVGEFVYRYDPSPAGVALSPGYLEDAEPCPQCTELGFCARCRGNGLSEEGAGPCSFCGWDYDDCLPQEPECFCWEAGW